MTKSMKHEHGPVLETQDQHNGKPKRLLLPQKWATQIPKLGE